MAQTPRRLSPHVSARHYFGAQLRSWRERRGWSQAQLANRLYVSADLVAKVEKAVRWPTTALASGCDAALETGGALKRLLEPVEAERREARATTRAVHAVAANQHLADSPMPPLATESNAGPFKLQGRLASDLIAMRLPSSAPGWLVDQLLGLADDLVEAYRRTASIDTPPLEEDGDVRRRPMIQLLAAGPLTRAIGGRVNPSESHIDSLERRAEIYRHLYHGIADPADLLGLARDHLADGVDAFRETSGGRLKTRILRNHSEVATLAGRLAYFDLHDAALARAFYDTAYRAAIQASDDALTAVTLGHLAFVPAHDGDTSTAVDYLTGAATHARRAGIPQIRSWTAAVESELVAVASPKASLSAADRAEKIIDESDGTPQPLWFDYYSRQRLAGFRGYALLKADRLEEARGCLNSALNGLAPAALKQRAVFLLDIATTHIVGGTADIDRACDLATRAVDNLLVAGYATGNDRLQQFRAQVRPWEHTPAVQALDERLGHLPI